ncbi:alpha/beta fold hydrolase [Paenibacillus chitinolyticus]|uniref:alpha/beta fold hydrolase n=1 Tax=Paenibacillus chitinolyticus TaxID=79263 RepID=UPI0036DAE9B5
MAHIFITGGTGFIGRHVLRALSLPGLGPGERESHRLTVLVRSLTRFDSILKKEGLEYSPHIRPVKGDLSLPSLGLDDIGLELAGQADILLHMGGPMDIGLGREEAENVFFRSSEEMVSLAKQIHKNRGLKHFIHLVGFKSPYHEKNADLPEHIGHPGEPPYENRKLAADLQIRKALYREGIPLSVVNPSVVIGDSATGVTEQTGGLGILVDSVRRGLMPLSPGGAGQWLPMVHADHAAAFIAALVREEEPANGTYFLLDEKSGSPDMRELARSIAKEVRVRGPFGAMPLPLLTKALGTKWGRKTGIPAESINFIADGDFPLASKQAVERKYKLDTGLNRDILPGTIADLDYRLSHGEAGLPGAEFKPGRLGKLAVWSRQEGSGIPVVLLHGTFSGALPLLPAASRLNGHPVYAADLPGFGRSPYHHGNDVIAGYVEAVTGALMELGEPVVLAGHSFGGLIAAKVMERLPGYVRGAVLLQPALHPAHVGVPAWIAGAYMKRMTERALVRKLLESGSFADEEEIPQEYVRYVLRDLASPRVRKTNADVFAALGNAGAFGLSPGKWDTGKVRLIWGGLDQRYRLPQAFRHLPVTEIPAGHQFPISHPDRTAGLILAHAENCGSERTTMERQPLF